MSPTIEVQRERVAESLKILRAKRKENRLCRECGKPLAEKDKTRCFNCKVKHSNREAILDLIRREKDKKKARLDRAQHKAHTSE